MANDPQLSFVFHLDASDSVDEIVYVASEWLAAIHAGQTVPEPPRVLIDRLRRRFIAPQHLYATVLKWVRDRGTAKMVLFRCDLSVRLRVMELRIAPLGARGLRLEGWVCRPDTLPDDSCFGDPESLNRRFVTICARFKEMVRSSANAWIDLDEATRDLGLFLAVPSPKLTHGFCPTCLAALVEELER